MAHRVASEPMNPRDQHLSSEFAAQCDQARATLLRHMADHGLRIEDGWWIHEFTRHVEGHTELVMRPMHRQLTAPPELECICTIDEHGADASFECNE